MKQYKQQDEDVLSYALFPQVATEFFKYRQAQQTKVDTTIADTKNGAYPVQGTLLSIAVKKRLQTNMSVAVFLLIGIMEYQNYIKILWTRGQKIAMMKS